MRAISAPEEEERETPAAETKTRPSPPRHESAISQQSDDGHSAGPPGAAARPADQTKTIKAESGCLDPTAGDSHPDHPPVNSTLRPAPPPSAKRRESEADLGLPESSEKRPNKKTKRAASPAWTFPTADVSTLKTADGRRVSARHNTSTPGASETESRGRGGSQSVPRSRQGSPPWKKFGAEGPTTLQVDGLRKSGRMNKELTELPKRVSPRSKKQADIPSTPQQVPKHGKRASLAQRSSMGGHQKTPEPSQKQEVKHLDLSPSSARKIAKLEAQIANADLELARRLSSPRDKKASMHKRKQSHDVAKHGRDTTPPLQRSVRRASNAENTPRTAKPLPRIKLRFSTLRQIIVPPHPRARMPSPARPPQLSLCQVIEEYELKEMQQPHMENDRGPPGAEYFDQRAAKQATDESAMRQRLLKEARAGGALSREHLSLFSNDRQSEPPQQYAHTDHLVAHALYLRSLQTREKASHRLLAKKLAHEALEKWKTKHGPTEEDIIVEQSKITELIKKQLVADLKALWERIESHIREARRRVWEAEQKKIQDKKLQEKLEFSQTLLARQRGEADSDEDMDEDSIRSFEDLMSGSETEEDEDGEDNISETSSEAASRDEAEDVEMDESTLSAYLAQKQEKSRDQDQQHVSSSIHEAEDEVEEGEGEVDDQGVDEHDHEHDHQPHIPGSGIEEEEEPQSQELPEEVLVEDEKAEDKFSSDESVEMYDSDEDMTSGSDEAERTKSCTNDDDQSDDEDDEDESEDDERPAEMRETLLAMYSAKELLHVKDGGLPTPVTSVENGGDSENSVPHSDTKSTKSDEHDEIKYQNMVDDREPSIILQVGHGNNALLSGDAELQSESAVESSVVEGMEQNTAFSEESMTRSFIPVPTLLRGTLRSYQHAGVDWLASLYRNGTNGILADEMGLGKTIQTIALLAHLAEVHEIWETHLVIVPTSVILNWATEFQKFLPGFRILAYYGTAEERQQKRRGWTNDPHNEEKDKRGYNVVITSYNVAVQDINALRNVQWHYLVLDEAHNIRNFNSQRWQVLIRLRTKARLLLTGTPLQNDLAEVWSLLTFLTAGDDDRSHGELEEFLSHWKDPVKEIFDQGVQRISENAQRVVDQLHVSLRPFLLRRKKSEVEKDLPKKIESVVVCKLSKRQRQLYQDYMGLAETKATLAKGSGVQAGAVLLSLRKVCNHPDMFDPRPIQTSFAMETSPFQPYAAIEKLVRTLLAGPTSIPDKLLIAGIEHQNRATIRRSRKLAASVFLQRRLNELEASQAQLSSSSATLAGSRVLQRHALRQRKLQQYRASIVATESSISLEPVYGADLRQTLTVHKSRPYLFSSRRVPNLDKHLRTWTTVGHHPLQLEHLGESSLIETTCLQQDIATLDQYAARLQDTITRFMFVPPAATAPMLDFVIPRSTQGTLRSSSAYPLENDWGHEARIRKSIAFPDSRLLIYDSGKLQRLVYLLRELQSKGSRTLIFTQMTGTLNILEQFLNLLNLPYLRLDGSTPVEKRQLYSAEFNKPDSRYQCMILSSRAGGVGLNLTGASSVIFYDLDWNPQMDRQCMDRAHRIGQMRDVEVYKMVSEKTVEENILRRANQKSLLDETVIQQGHFTTEYQQTRNRQESQEPAEGEVAAAIERFIGGDDDKMNTQAMESVEDKEDVEAARQAAKEDRQDDMDFVDRSSKGPSKANTPGVGNSDEDETFEKTHGHIDHYMIRHMEYLLQGWQYVPAPVRKLDKHGRDPSHRPKRKR